jgi:hypothetical protein
MGRQQCAQASRLNFVNATFWLIQVPINLIHQRTIAVERFTVLDFCQSLPNARLQQGGTDITPAFASKAGFQNDWQLKVMMRLTKFAYASALPKPGYECRL